MPSALLGLMVRQTSHSNYQGISENVGMRPDNIPRASFPANLVASSKGNLATGTSCKPGAGSLQGTHPFRADFAGETPDGFGAVVFP